MLEQFPYKQEPSEDKEREGEGRKLLHELEATGQYVFHGSPSADISELEPRQPHEWSDGTEKPDGDPCVAATPYADIAIFRALAYTDTTGFGSEDDGTLSFRATQKALDDATNKTGYVYVLDIAGFQPRNGGKNDMEYRTCAPSKPARIVRVTFKDLPENIALIAGK